jgi:hypothetical protein
MNYFNADQRAAKWAGSLSVSRFIPAQGGVKRDSNMNYFNADQRAAKWAGSLSVSRFIPAQGGVKRDSLIGAAEV